MTRLGDRQSILQEIAQARAAGARLGPACALAGIDPRTRRRWQGSGQADASAEVRADRRPEAARPTPSQALTTAERAQIVAVANEPRFADAPPARIVPALADEGIYIASESSFHRVLRSCPWTWCSSVDLGLGRGGQAATAGSLTRGASLSAAKLSRLM
jgi:hypothetical protein